MVQHTTEYTNFSSKTKCEATQLTGTQHSAIPLSHHTELIRIGFKFRSQFIAHCSLGGREGRDHRREEWRDHLALC